MNSVRTTLVGSDGYLGDEISCLVDVEDLTKATDTDVTKTSSPVVGRRTVQLLFVTAK